MLSGPEIARLVRSDIPNGRKVVIEGFDENRVGPNSFDLTLSDQLIAVRGHPFLEEVTDPEGNKYLLRGVLDMKQEPQGIPLTIPTEGLILLPGWLYLGCTREYTETHGLVPMIDGTSSAARLGVSVHLTAGFGDAAFQGQWTLEITVVLPIRVYAGVPICQIYFEPLEGETKQYAGNYQGQRGPQQSKMWKKLAKMGERAV